jgi:hypothetical protein
LKNKKIFILLTIVLTFDSFGQISDSLKTKLADTYIFSKKNSLNFEAFGHGLYYSLSYERIIVNDYHFKFAGQGGVSVYPYPDQIDLWLPISLNYIKTFGVKRKHHAEVGIGHVVRYDQFYDGSLSYPWQTFITAKAGYRYQKPSGRWIFKILFTPFYEYDSRNKKSIQQPNYSKTLTSDNPYPSGALSIGYTF